MQVKKFVGIFDGEIEGEKLAEPLCAGIWLGENGETLAVVLDFIANDWVSREFFEKVDYSTLEYKNGKLTFEFDGKPVELREIERIEWEDLDDYYKKELEWFEKQF